MPMSMSVTMVSVCEGLDAPLHDEECYEAAEERQPEMVSRVVCHVLAALRAQLRHRLGHQVQEDVPEEALSRTSTDE